MGNRSQIKQIQEVLDRVPLISPGTWRLPPVKRTIGGAKLPDQPTSDHQINQIMSELIPELWLGCLASDQVQDLKVPRNQDSCAIVNLDEASGPGTHWVALWISMVDRSIEWYDSLALQPDPRTKIGRRLLKGTQKFVERLRLPYRLRLKFNRFADQSDNSLTCGYFAMEFLLSRATGETFSQASGFESIKKGESEIYNFKKNLVSFGYI